MRSSRRAARGVRRRVQGYKQALEVRMRSKKVKIAIGVSLVVLAPLVLATLYEQNCGCDPGDPEDIKRADAMNGRVDRHAEP